MKLIRRVAHFAFELNKIQAEAVVRLYGRLNLFRMLYVACGVPEEVAARLEEKMLGATYLGVDEQHELFMRWIKGEINLVDLRDRYLDWFREHLDRCSRITVDELRPAM